MQVQEIQGLGLPFIIVPLLYIFIGEITATEGAHAASLFNLSRSLSTTIATAWSATSLRLHSESKYAELLSNTGLYPAAHQSALAVVSGRISHTSPDTAHVHLQAITIVAQAARLQASVLAISDTLADLGWLLFVACLLVIMMAEFGSGRPRDSLSRTTNVSSQSDVFAGCAPVAIILQLPQ